MNDNAAYLPDDADHPDFSTVKLEDGEMKKKKLPRRVLHFSDGILEEYSSSEEDEVDTSTSPQTVVDPRTLPWGPWFWNRMVTTSIRTLSAIDFCGEKLAGFFGILDSRYQYAIDEYRKNQKEEEREREMERLEEEAIRMREVRKAEEMENGDGNASVQIISTGEVIQGGVRKIPVELDLPSEQI